MKPTLLVAFASGLLFAVGLSISGMTQPGKVMAFLDVSGAWDPSLAFVMAGAIAVHVGFARRATRAGTKPLLAEHYVLPTSSRIDTRLVAGSLLFGLGWGAAGFCPGPAVVASVTLAPTTLLFVATMLLGMFMHGAAFGKRAKILSASSHAGSS